VILAAGASSRMGQPKALLQYRGETFLDRLVRLFAERCAPVVVVLGYHADVIRAGVKDLTRASVVVNPAPERGQLSSMQCGLRKIAPECSGFLFSPVDYPAVEAETVRRVAEELSSATTVRPGPFLVVPRYSGRRGHPVGASRDLIGEFLALPAEATARDVIHDRLDSTLYVEVNDSGILRDIDDPESYHELAGERPLK
jgi:molybdenum cofactor cytidylyltransferase